MSVAIAERANSTPVGIGSIDPLLELDGRVETSALNPSRPRALILSSRG